MCFIRFSQKKTAIISVDFSFLTWGPRTLNWFVDRFQGVR